MLSRALVFISLIATISSTACSDDQKKADADKNADALQIISAKALGALAIRDVAELTDRGDEFIEKTELNMPMRVSEAYNFVVGFLGISRGLDEDGAAALMVFEESPDMESFVLAVPVADFKLMAANFNLDRDQLAEGKVIDRKDADDRADMEFVRYLSVRGNHLLMGGSRGFVELAATGKSLHETLPEDDRKSLALDDIVLFLNAQDLVKDWDEALRELDRELEDYAPEEADVLRQVAASATDLKYVIGGVRLDKGLGATVVLKFDGDKSREILTRLQAGAKPNTSLAGLPAGRILAAHASSGDGDQSAAVARALLQLSLKTILNDTDPFISVGHQANVVGVFGEVWQRLEGSRTALYENANPERDGIFSVVSILETDNAERFIADMTGLARFVNAATLSEDEAEAEFDQQTIRALIKELGDDDYRVRQLATTKLGLIGKPALPALEEALESSDPEVQFRARSAKRHITQSLAGEREELIHRDLLARIKPTFAYFPEQETRAGRSVGIVQLQLNEEEAPFADQLRRLLGSQWNKMRLAAVGKRVVVLFGSDTALMDQAIANMQDDKQPAHAEDQIAAFRSRTKTQQTVEFHLSLAKAQQLIRPDGVAGDVPKADGDANAVTSFGLSIAPQRIRFDLYSPYLDVRSVIKTIQP